MYLIRYTFYEFLTKVYGIKTDNSRKINVIGVVTFSTKCGVGCGWKNPYVKAEFIFIHTTWQREVYSMPG